MALCLISLPKVVSYPANLNSVVKRGHCKPLKLKLRLILAGCTVAIVNYYVTKMITTCSPIIEQSFHAITVASTDKGWLQ